MAVSTPSAVPAPVAPDGALVALARMVARGGVVVLSGAGLSTESGIPDYRGDGSRPRRMPMTYRTFVSDPTARRRYWARGHLGWRQLAQVRPNQGHQVVAWLEAAGLVDQVVTQNVDGLHQAAGSSAVVDLHGRLDRVVCLRCGSIVGRGVVADLLDQANPGWAATPTGLNPDGDVELPDDALDSFCVVDCVVCGGLLKPDVVYAGESVPAPRVEAACSAVDRARSVLVLGSSLTVWSGRRLVVRAGRAGVPVAIVNDGPTRGDALAAVTVGGRLGTVLDRLRVGLSG